MVDIEFIQMTLDIFLSLNVALIASPTGMFVRIISGNREIGHDDKVPGHGRNFIFIFSRLNNGGIALGIGYYDVATATFAPYKFLSWIFSKSPTTSIPCSRFCMDTNCGVN